MAILTPLGARQTGGPFEEKVRWLGDDLPACRIKAANIGHDIICLMHWGSPGTDVGGSLEVAMWETDPGVLWTVDGQWTKASAMGSEIEDAGLKMTACPLEIFFSPRWSLLRRRGS